MENSSENILKEFMSNENKKALGEEVETISEENDNFLPAEEVSRKSFTGEENATGNDKAYLAARRALNMAITIPLLICGLVSAAYLSIKAFPYILNTVRIMFLSLIR